MPDESSSGGVNTTKDTGARPKKRQKKKNKELKGRQGCRMHDWLLIIF